MKLDWRKAQFFGDVCVLDLQSFINLQHDDNNYCQMLRWIHVLVTLVRWTLTDLPFTHSVARELEAIAEPQPKVLNRASMILPCSSTWI